MAARDGNIRLILRSGAFQAGIRRLTTQVAVAGRQMGKSLSAPMSDGIGAAKKSLTGLGGISFNNIC